MASFDAIHRIYASMNSLPMSPTGFYAAKQLLYAATRPWSAAMNCQGAAILIKCASICSIQICPNWRNASNFSIVEAWKAYVAADLLFHRSAQSCRRRTIASRGSAWLYFAAPET